MAGLIWCKGKYSTRPYYISNMAVNIYSMEELSYYIYNNIYLIGTDLFDTGLIDFIDRELGEKELAEELEFLSSQNAGLAEMVITVLRHVDYYSEEEISELRKVIDMLDTQNALERLKLRADNFLSRTVDRQAKPKDSGGSGGSSTHVSSSGTTHGGSSGKF